MAVGVVLYVFEWSEMRSCIASNKRNFMTVFLLLFFLLCQSPTALAGENSLYQEPLKFGVISLNHPLEMYRNYLPFTDFISKKVGIKIQLVLSKDYETIVKYLAKGKIDIALVAGVTYLDTRKMADVTPLCAILSKNSTPTSYTVFIARDDRTDIKCLADLKGKRFAFGSRYSTSSYLEPLVYLIDQGFLPSEFSFFENLNTQEAVARSILRGTHDAGAISDVTFQRFAVAGLKQIAKTERYPGFLVVASAMLAPKHQQAIKDVLLGLDYTTVEVAEASKTWSLLLRNGFTTTTDKDYDLIRRHMENMRQNGLYKHQP